MHRAFDFLQRSLFPSPALRNSGQRVSECVGAWHYAPAAPSWRFIQAQ
jgi:hypothetical protein